MFVLGDYTINYICANIFCIIIVFVILAKQLSFFNKTETQKTYIAVLLTQIAYFVTCCILISLDSFLIEAKVEMFYFVNIMSFSIYSYGSYMVFRYLVLYQNLDLLEDKTKEFIYSLPIIVNTVLILTSPFTHLYFEISDTYLFYLGKIWYLMVILNCFYPFVAFYFFIYNYLTHKKKYTKDEFIEALKITVMFPLIYLVCGPLQSLEWRFPLLCYSLTLADIFIYVHYTDWIMRQRNQILQLEKESADAKNKAKTTFLSNMSHDIRTPMNAIVGFTDLAIERFDDPEKVRSYLSKIKSSSAHLLSLINDVLEMSRIESGKIDLEEQQVNFPSILHELNTIILSQAISKNQKLFMDANGVINENVFCDKLRLNQVLLNIVGNAVKYTPSGGKIIVRLVQTEGAPEGYGNYEIHVKDNGIGMTPEFAAKIFEAFEREKTSTVSGIQGTGLGMAITKRIVELMGGTIDVITAPNEGSEFVVKLKLRVQDKVEPSPDLAILKGCHALVIDDDFNTCDSVTKILINLGIHAEWTMTGSEAILRSKQALDRNDGFDIYIIDWALPDVNGNELVQEISKLNPEKSSIIVMTAYTWMDIKDEAMKAGAHAFCGKPIFESDLEKILLSVSGTKQEDVETSTSADEYSAHFEGMRVLLVDDIELNRELAATILEMNGFAVDQATDGTEAVDLCSKAEEGYYDIVLMDIQMPTMNGYEAAKAIRALPGQKSRVPILAMTANAFEEDKKAAFAAGMDGHLAKPIDIQKLLETLKTIIKKK